MLSYVKGFVSRVISFVSCLRSISYFPIRHEILANSILPAACRFLNFWARHVKSFWQNSDSGELERENSYGSQSWGNTKKKHIFNAFAFSGTMVMIAGNTIAFPCYFGVFMRIHMRVPMFLRKHIPNVEIFEHHVYRCGNIFSIDTRLRRLFCPCVETHAHWDMVP